MNRSVVFAAALAVLLSGCSAVGVVASSDPHVKIAQAEEMQREGRYARARQLLDGALEIFQRQNDEEGVGEVYRAYGFYYRAGMPEGVVRAVSSPIPVYSIDSINRS